ncbi:hypothetical protein O6H91_09G032100 [Diphasiastrum complanatum]|uniref:Uncharacterized protein n=1 Tax=Diphasiastrum complanatum TaxID=34168 RepID=A0ACC2CMX3_DIPCM|nr:hypothetical protein O6H91_09G032100 [Diphasiastrum complanatum]
MGSGMQPLEEDMAALLKDFDALEKMYRDVKVEIKETKASLAVEIKKREAAEAICSSLEREKQWWMKFQEENMANTILQEHEQSLHTITHQHKESMAKMECELRNLQDCINAKDVAMTYFEEEVAQLHVIIDDIKRDAEQLQRDEHEKCRHEVEELAILLEVEKREREKSQSDLQKAEHWSMLTKLKYEEQIREMSSNRFEETLKHKIMKLRKENEDLKRQLLCFQA